MRVLSSVFTAFLVTSCGMSCVGSAVPPAVADMMQTPALRDVRLEGYPADKMNAFIHERMMTPFAQKEIFGEARRAFADRDDDEKKVGGLWKGEFWGKLMLSTARTADYLQDSGLLAFVREECHRMMALQDPDGYLGSYANKELVSIRDRAAAQKAYGWNTVWNLWNRKYAMWGLLTAYRVTGDKSILTSVEAQMDQWITMMHRLGLPLIETGQPEKVGLPSMSVLKPLLMLYADTGKSSYLDYAKEIVKDWDRPDGRAPNFYRNAMNGKPLYTWYPDPDKWGKCYEMMSCLDGLLEYYRVTGDRRSLDTVMAIRENLFDSESNALGGVGYCDQFNGAAKRMNAITEVCDTIHWIRLNLDLYLLTGDLKYADAMERCYFNAFLAGVFRSGQWSAFAVRGHVRHVFDHQCGYAYNHCCVNNVPRTFMDMASSVVTLDRSGTYHVNFYQDAEVSWKDAKFKISGNYPVGNCVTVCVETVKSKAICFRVPDWCPGLHVNGTASSAGVRSVRCQVPAGGGVYTLTFDMNPRVVERPLAHDADADNPNHWIRTRYQVNDESRVDIPRSFRTEPAAQVMYGPLILAKAKRAGAKKSEIADGFTVNGKGYSVHLKAEVPDGTWGAWTVELTKPGAQTIRVRACDYESAADEPLPHGANAFSVWF